MTIYEVIVSHCRAKHISISKFESNAGLGNGTVKKWKTSSPTLDNVSKVATAMGIKTSTLIKKTEAS